MPQSKLSLLHVRNARRVAASSTLNALGHFSSPKFVLGSQIPPKVKILTQKVRVPSHNSTSESNMLLVSTNTPLNFVVYWQILSYFIDIKVTLCRNTAPDHTRAYHAGINKQQRSHFEGLSNIRPAWSSPLIRTDLYAPMWSEVVLL